MQMQKSCREAKVKGIYVSDSMCSLTKDWCAEVCSLVEPFWEVKELTPPVQHDRCQNAIYNSGGAMPCLVCFALTLGVKFFAGDRQHEDILYIDVESDTCGKVTALSRGIAHMECNLLDCNSLSRIILAFVDFYGHHPLASEHFFVFLQDSSQKTLARLQLHLLGSMQLIQPL